MHIVVPSQIRGYDIRGGRLALLALASGSEPGSLLLERRFTHAGQEREPVILVEHTVPGEKLLVAAFM